MKIFSAAQIKTWDQQTIANEPIPSATLMERAARQLFHWFEKNIDKKIPIHIFCGPGNNGGDGLALARMLSEIDYRVQVYLLPSSNYSLDNVVNQQNLPEKVAKATLNDVADFPALNRAMVVVDALYGIGIRKSIEGLGADLIQHINDSGALTISVDIPSGLYPDQENKPEDAIIEASFTLSFQVPKLSFFLSQQADYVGNWTVIPIGLDADFYTSEVSDYHLITEHDVSPLLTPRPLFSHKGDYGHALLIAGSYGMMGAAALVTKACLRSGVGLVTTLVPPCGYQIMQTSVPEAMVLTSSKEEENFISTMTLPTERYTAIGLGPGLSKGEGVSEALANFLQKNQQALVVDADALNAIAFEKSLLTYLPPNSILTPHIGEFTRLTKEVSSDYERLDLLKEFCQKYNLIVVLKNAKTAIGLPDGSIYFNDTGNPGMATAGSGDVLTGIITALVAQGYSMQEAAMLGVYKHGLAGDKAAEKRGEEALIASDIIDNLS